MINPEGKKRFGFKSDRSNNDQPRGKKEDLVLNLIVLIMINPEGKKDLVLNQIVLIMINPEEKKIWF